MHGGRIGLKLRGALEQRDAFARIARFEQRAPQRRELLRILRGELRHATIDGQCFDKPPLAAQRSSQGRVRRNAIRVDCERFPARGFALAELAGVDEHRGEIAIRRGVAGTQCDCRAIRVLGFAETLQRVERTAEIVMRVGEGRIELGRARE